MYIGSAVAPAGDALEPWRSVQALTDALNLGAKRPSFTDSAIRNYLAKRQENGLDRFVRKVGKKIIVSEPGFNYWLAQQWEEEQRQWAGGNP